MGAERAGPKPDRTVIQPPGPANRGRLSRAAIVERALAIGTAESLDAVSVRRLASEFHVTPMALYRHVRDKQDLVNAMTESVLEDFDITRGFEPGMSWSDRLRRAMTTYKEEMDARPLALPLSIAYSGDGPLAFWQMLESLLAILLDAGFERRTAIVLIRVISNLLAGYLVLLRQSHVEQSGVLDARQVDIVRRQLELSALRLPEERFPNLLASAEDLADVWISDPDRWWRDTVELIALGLEGMRNAEAPRT